MDEPREVDAGADGDLDGTAEQADLDEQGRKRSRRTPPRCSPPAPWHGRVRGPPSPRPGYRDALAGTDEPPMVDPSDVTRANSRESDLSQGKLTASRRPCPSRSTRVRPEADMRSTCSDRLLLADNLAAAEAPGSEPLSTHDLQRPTTAGRPTIPSASGTRPARRHVMAGEARRREALGERQRQRLSMATAAQTRARAPRGPPARFPRLRRRPRSFRRADRGPGNAAHEAENVADEAATTVRDIATDGVQTTFTFMHAHRLGGSQREPWTGLAAPERARTSSVAQARIEEHYIDSHWCTALAACGIRGPMSRHGRYARRRLRSITDSRSRCGA